MKRKVYNDLLKKKSAGRKALAVLIDPDKSAGENLHSLINIAVENNIDYFFVGGSLVSNYNFKAIIQAVKSACEVPVLIFPGSYLHIYKEADALLLLSLISGRNAELLIGQQVVAAPVIRSSGLETIATGYLLIDGGKPTTVSYMSGTQPIPRDKQDIARWTAVAGEMLGLKLIYLDAGSGADLPAPPEMIKSVSEAIDVPLVVGGGLNTLEKIKMALYAGADLVVIGNGIEKKPDFIIEVSDYFNQINKSLNVN